MTFEMINLSAVGSEILLLGGACAILMVGAFGSQLRAGGALVYWLSLIVLSLVCGVTLLGFGGNVGSALGGHFFRDGMGDLVKLFVYFSVLVSFIYSRDYLQRHGLFSGEFFALGLFAVLGMSVIISSGSFIAIFMGLELLALPLYAMVALDRDSVVATESAMRYFVRGAIATSVLLYGMSMLYGATGTLNLVQVSDVVQRLIMEPVESIGQKQALLVLGTVFVLLGVSFKFGSLPLQMWIPHDGKGIPAAVSVFLGAMPKLVAFVMVLRLLMGTFDPLLGRWPQMLAVTILALLSTAVGGNLVSGGRQPSGGSVDERDAGRSLFRTG
jgi:NADH-quinone oxidoreductase subunit N